MSAQPSLSATAAGIERVPIVRSRAGACESSLDDVAVEEPLEIRLSGETFVTTLRTPGSDHELVCGFLLAEGVIQSSRDLLNVAHCGRPDQPGYGNVIDVQLAPEAARGWDANATRRVGLISSACGVCGRNSIDELRARLSPLPPSSRFDAAWLQALPETLRAAQRNFARTGGLHAAGIAASGQPLEVVREDVGRHNAVDKVLGRLLLDDALPARNTALVVSGRAGFEIVHKAVGAGVSALVSVSAPSSLAVETARAFGLLLLGFTRTNGFNVYAATERLFDEEAARTV